MIAYVFKEGKILTIVKEDSCFYHLGMERYTLFSERCFVCYLNHMCVHLTLFRFEVKHFAGW